MPATGNHHRCLTPTRFAPKWVTLATTTLLLGVSGCSFQGLLAKYGQTQDSNGAAEMQQMADEGRAQLNNGELAEATAAAPRIWRGFVGNDSRKGGIATLYFREFCDALYEAEKTRPAFEIAALFQMAVAGFPKEISRNKEEYVKADIAQLGQRATAAAARAKPELEGLAVDAGKRGHIATELLYRAQLMRMYGDDAANKAALATGIGQLKAKHTAIIAFTGDAPLAKLVLSAAGRPSKIGATPAMLLAEGALAAANCSRSKAAITLTANVVRGKKTLPNSRYATFRDRVKEHEQNIRNHQDAIARELKHPQPRQSVINTERQGVERNERQRDDAAKSLAKEQPTTTVDNVVAVDYPAVREVLTCEQQFTGKVAADNDKIGQAISQRLTAMVEAVTHEGLAEAKIEAQKQVLPADETLRPAVAAQAANLLRQALAVAFDKRLHAGFQAWLGGSTQEKAEAETALLALTELPDPASRVKRIAMLARLPDVAGLLRMATSAKAD